MFSDSQCERDENKTNTHLQQKGPRSRLCPRRRCSSGVGKLPRIQTQGTLQNRHVKSQARESHWKKIQICCAKNTNKDTLHAFLKTVCVPRCNRYNNGLQPNLSCFPSSALSKMYLLRIKQYHLIRRALA